MIHKPTLVQFARRSKVNEMPHNIFLVISFSMIYCAILMVGIIFKVKYVFRYIRKIIILFATVMALRV